jgi:hypothetical protein
MIVSKEPTTGGSNPSRAKGPAKEQVMRFIGWNVAIASWMLISAFALPQTATSSAITAVGAFLVPLIALFAGAKPGVRYVISIGAIALAVLMVLLPGVSAAARISNALVAALFFALSLVSPRHRTMATAHR